MTSNTLADRLEKAISEAQEAETLEMVAHYERKLSALCMRNGPAITAALRGQDQAVDVEAVARAICKANESAWSDDDERNIHWFVKAKAALASMGEGDG